MTASLHRPAPAGPRWAAVDLARRRGVVVALVGAVALGLLSVRPLLAGIVAAVALAGVAGAVILRRPSMVVAVAVLSMWFDNFGAGPVRTGRVVAVLVTGLALLRVATSGWRPPALERRAWLPTAAFVTWAVLSGFWSIGLGTWSQGLFELMLGVAYAAALVLFLESEPQMARACKLFVWTGVPIALLSWFLYRGLQTTAKETGLENRTHGFTGNANVYAFVLVASVPLAVVFIRRARSGLERLAYVGVLGALSLALVASGSRSGLLTMAAMVMYCAVTLPGLDRRRRAASAVAGTVLVVGGVLIAGAVNPERFSLGGFVNDAGAGRIELWNAAVQTFGRHPVHGTGIGGFRAQILDILTKVDGTLDITRNPVNRDAKNLEAHNLYLSLLLDLGIVGLVLWVVQYLSVARNLFDLRRSVWRDWAWAFGGTQLCLLVTAAFGSSYNMKFSWTILGFSAAMYLRRLQAAPATAVGRALERPTRASRSDPADAPAPSRSSGAAPTDLRLPVPLARVLVAAAVVGACVAATTTAVWGTTRHATSAEVLVVNLDAAGPAQAGVAVADARIQTVLSLARSDPFLAELRRRARLEGSVADLAQVVDATRPGFSSVVRLEAVVDDEAAAGRISRALLSSLDAAVEQYRTGAIALTDLGGRAISPDVAPEYRGPIYLRLWDVPRVQEVPPPVGFAGVVGAVSGLLLAVVAAFLAHDRARLGAGEDVAALLGVPFVAALPAPTRRPGRGRRRGDAAAALGTAADLVDAAGARGARRVAVAGVGTPRRRAQAATSLAVALASSDPRPVVLVDLDLDRTALTRLVGARRDRGWSDLADVGSGELPGAVEGLARPVRVRRLPRALRGPARPHRSRITVVPVGDGGRAAGAVVDERWLARLVDALATDASGSDAIVVLHLGEVPGPLPLRQVVAACDSVLVVVVDGWTPTVAARTVATTLASVAPRRVGYVVVEN